MLRKVVCVVIVLAVLLVFTAAPAVAWDPWGDNPQKITKWSPYQWWNYDFESPQTPVEGQSEHCDWPVGLIYWYEADCVKVKNLYWDTALFDDMFWNEVSDGAWWEWHPDKGTKDYWGGTHMRPYGRDYGDGIYKLENDVLGSYVVATAHRDFFHWFRYYSGYSESAEYRLGNSLQDRGYLVDWDCENLLNYEEYRWVGTHVWENNGWATKIRIH